MKWLSHPQHDALSARPPTLNPNTMRSDRSVAVSDAILAAQCAFDGGEFQPEAFPRCVCLLLEAFEGGDNTVRLCTARLLERFRPYFGGNILAVEVR